jgi:N-acetyl-gamma-glutamyl-phosphate reductase
LLKAGLVGATGYTGAETLRLLLAHPEVELQVVTSRAEQGRPVAEFFPWLRGHTGLRYSSPDDPALQRCDVVFFATPGATAMEQVPGLVEAGVRVIDLSADFRLADAEEWSRWYGRRHACPELLAEAVYGLPEQNREAIRGARVVANPGCYPTAVILALLPLLAEGSNAAGDLVADVKSGVSGAGRRQGAANLFAEAADSLRAYAAGGHRHLPEIRQALAQAAGAPVEMTFVPHLVPMIRGIHATVYARLDDDGRDVQVLYERFFAGEPFVDVLPAGSHPDTRSVRGTNFCRLALHRPGPHRLVVLAVIDNLVKGAAGQAVQNMNIMFGFPETLGLEASALAP